MAKIGFMTLSASLCGALILGLAAQASAEELMGNTPWSFQPQNRAGIAALIEEQANGTTDGASGGGTSTACGGGGTSTATGNYTCIIVNDSTADISALQEALGNQGSTAETTATANGVPEEQLSSILEALSN